MEIRVDDVGGPEIAALLREHLDDMARHSPAESVHALDLAGLRGPEMTVWTLWEGAALAGCGALRQLTDDHGEVKSMRTARSHLRRGVAAALLARIIDEATHRGWTRLSLETGSAAAFLPARTLYARAGFEPCGPFGDYAEDPFSVFMTLRLPAPAGPHPPRDPRR